MPNNQVFGDVIIEHVQERFAREYHLSRQEALMMALLVKYPTVTPDTIRRQIGQIDHGNLISRLRKKLNANDDKVLVNTVTGFGFCLDGPTRERLAGVDPSVPRPAATSRVRA